MMYMIALTEYGWCTFENIAEEVHWISNITDNNIRINQINIPGIHDSGTYTIGDRELKFSWQQNSIWSNSRNKYF